MHIQIKELREEAGLTQTDLAEGLGYRSRALIAMWESGQRKPPSDKLPKLAKILNCSINDLFKENNTTS